MGFDESFEVEFVDTTDADDAREGGFVIVASDLGERSSLTSATGDGISRPISSRVLLIVRLMTPESEGLLDELYGWAGDSSG